MSVATHDDVLKKRKSRRGRRKGMAALRKLRQALARRKLEEMRDEELLQEQIYDVLAED
ncbi:MAG: hypothetical protein OEN52_07590 [Gammaproteobacteria bacterium]|nr:hypothetical protein [Gammaproteobacteria bacterium]MDH3560801.1 hypothetical protein [Gammaproteobacteria bacterium]